MLQIVPVKPLVLCGLNVKLHVAGGETSAQKRKADQLDAAEHQQADAAEGPGPHKQVSSPTCPMLLNYAIDNLNVFATQSLRSQCLCTDGSSVCKHPVKSDHQWAAPLEPKSVLCCSPSDI